jgi:tRNA threonylcarbamoyladenosine biosynthesis protein TsaE
MMAGPRRRAPAEEPGSIPGFAGRTVYTLNERETFELGESIGRVLSGGELLLLEGELGMGKTVLARGVAAGLGIAPEDVSSPSFTLVQEYRGGRLPMFHVDLYRLRDSEDIATLGLDEILSSNAVIVMEWAEKLSHFLRKQGIAIRFHDLGEDSRRIEVLPE